MQENRSRAGLSLPCFALALLTAATPGGGMATQGSHSVIALQCPQHVQQSDALCRSMAVALARRSPTSAVQTLKTGEELELRADDLLVALHVDDMTAFNITAHLEWQRGEIGELSAGPQIEFRVMDTELRPALFDKFADGLLSASPAFLETLP